MQIACNQRESVRFSVSLAPSLSFAPEMLIILLLVSAVLTENQDEMYLVNYVAFELIGTLPYW